MAKTGSDYPININPQVSQRSSDIKRILLVIFVLLSLGCTLPSMVGMAPSAPGVPTNYPYVQAGPDATTTATPFLPLSPTQIYLPTEYPTPKPTPKPTRSFSKPVSKSWEDYPGPTLWPDIDVPPPTGLLPQPVGQVNILLLGSDVRPNEGIYRTDTILLLTINPVKQTANITSFPRDLYLYIPGWTVQRINTAQAHGDFPLTALTFEYNFGVHPDHYVLVNFASFSNIIDDLGGISVDVAVTLTDHRDAYGDYTVRAGRVHMDGETALWYVRSRYSTSDFDRGRRQQEVLMGIFSRLISLDAISRAPQFYKIYRNSVYTDLKLSDISPLLPVATKLTDTSRIHHYYIGPQQVVPWVNSYGAQVLVPIRQSVLEVMRKALNCPTNN